MNPLEFVTSYRALFGLASKTNDSVFEAWIAQLIRLDLPPADLAEAWAAIAGNPPPAGTYLTDRWPLTLEAIRAIGHKRRAAEERSRREADIAGENYATAGRCALCDGHGDALVPHPKYVRGGEWASREGAGGPPKFPTIVVCCECPAGQRQYEKLKGTKYPMPSLLDYKDRVVRHWQRLMREAADIKAGHWAAIEAGRKADRAARQPTEQRPTPPTVTAQVNELVERAQLPPAQQPPLPPPRKKSAAPF